MIYFCRTCGKLEFEYTLWSTGIDECYLCCHGYQKDQREHYIKYGRT